MNRIYTRTALGLLAIAACSTSFAARPEAAKVIRDSGIQGGLVVHVGCADGRWTASLRQNDRYVVQGLDVDSSVVASAAKQIDAAGAAGKVTFRQFDGHRLPYVDNLVNLLVVEQRFSVSTTELQRVLAPGGVAYLHTTDGWQTVKKPVPPAFDEWTHFYHDASGNQVSHDKVAGPPKGLRWTSGPRWCRSHEWPTSVQCVVTSAGRIFSILDESPIGVFRHLPQTGRLVARDAYSGVLLWKVPLKKWQPEFGTGTANRWQMHHTIARRLIALGDRVYTTLQFADSPVSVLDAATGQVIEDALPDTRGADELLLTDGVLVVKCVKGVSVGATLRIQTRSFTEQDRLVAIDVNTKNVLWQKTGIRILPYALAADSKHVVYHDASDLVCIDLRTGAEAWRRPYRLIWTFGGGVALALSDDVVLLHARGQLETQLTSANTKTRAAAQGAASKKKRRPAGGRFMNAFSLQDGKLLWQLPGHESLAGASTMPAEIFVTNGTVWFGRTTDGVDLHTGKVVQTVDLANLISPGHHYRCYRGKATDRYLIWPKRGAEFVDLQDGNHMRHDWLRAPCFTSFIPANGLFYVPPSQCFCYPGVIMSGYLALSAQPAVASSLAGGQLETPEAAAASRVSEVPAGPDDWPMYRNNGMRSGASSMQLGAKLRLRWQASLATVTPQAIAVGKRVWVTEKDAHHVRCLNAQSGDTLWMFAAGGRIDSPPTYWNGRLLFGCRDGNVFCLSATTGKLIWRFRAGPDMRQIMAYDQLESIWPVNGSVLVEDGVVYFAAGRSSFLDGGMAVYGLDATDGHVVAQSRLVGPWPDIKEDVGAPFAMDGARPDLMVSDGTSLFMGRIKFDRQLNRIPLTPSSSLGELDMGVKHLVATGGFLDDSGNDRMYWMYSRWWPGFYLTQHSPNSGQQIVFNDSTTFAVKYYYRRILWATTFFPGEAGYLLYADDKTTEPKLLEHSDKSEGLKWLPTDAYSDRYRRGGQDVEKGTGWVRLQPPKWQAMIPTRVRALLLAGDCLYAAGVPDKVPADDPLAAFEGRLGGVLQVFSTTDGKLLAKYDLDAPPAFDGLSAANGQLYLATRDGKLLCFRGER